MNCEECPFKGSQKVYGEGSRIVGGKRDNEGQYDVVAVGMAPAKEELKQGRVLVGASGQILRKVMESMNITEYYLCNVLLCSIEEESAGNQAAKCCRDIIEEIRARKPKLTIALGDMPLQKLITDEAKKEGYTIREVEGRILPGKTGPLLPLTHPAYYWRHPTDFFDFIECMRSGMRFLDGTYTQATDPTREIVTRDTLDEVRNKIDKHEWIAVDTETTGFDAYGWEPDHLLEMGISVDEKHAYIVPAPLIPEFKEILEGKKGIYWNAQFDAAFLKQVGINARVEYDGLLAHYSLDERSYSHGLKKVARVYLGCDNWEKSLDEYIPKRQKKSISYEVVPTEIRYEYLSKDVTRTYQLKDAMESGVNRKIFDRILMPACRMFIEIEHKGMRVDPMLMMEMAPLLEDDMARIENELKDMTGMYLNPNSPKQVQELVYGQLGYPVDHYLGAGTGKEALEPFKGDPIIDKILEYRQLSKTVGTYIIGFAKYMDQNHRIHPNLNLFKAVTGRLSSDKPSIMNIKANSRLKEMFLPDEGQILLYGDIKGNELRWYGIENKDEYVLNNFREDYKARLRGATEEELDQYDTHYQVGLKAAKGNKALAKESHYRTAVKAGVFGQIYQRTRASMARQFGEEVVDDVMLAVKQSVPGIEDYYKKVVKEVTTRGYLISYFGRKRRFGLITPETRKYIEREAVNFYPQSAGSDMMLLCMLYLWENKKKWDIWPFWPVHDSITMNGPSPDVLPEIKKALEDYSLELVDGVCPFVWEMDFGIDWSLRKTK